ncbi:Aste57867_19857 [Aphanomyces stellatus]|uniref:protein-tyrosine-phosphatase n=1 Tax=Aphanomyces stellatus TaxID=120398 RepID=A0A485LE56_9STRA|nr:hypothetical protein As57867_019791 [Aphanomyces stellatus]VFT96555.1 Aste57867_19857 [Aphanomyces stellatus]
MAASDAAPSEILPFLFLGSRQHAKDRDVLKRLSITHILNVTPTRKVDPVAGVPNFFEKEAAFMHVPTYRRCALFDNQGEDILTSLDGCNAFIDQAKFHGRILVHCKAGVSRSASIVVAYLMKEKEWTFDDALAAVQEKRPMANPNASFRAQLQSYETRLRRPVKAHPPSRKAQPEATAAIGPQLPPHLKRPACTPANECDDDEAGPSKDDNDDNEASTKKRKVLVD